MNIAYKFGVNTLKINGFIAFLPNCQRGQTTLRTLYRKTVKENVDSNLLTKQYFLRTHTEEENRKLVWTLYTAKPIAASGWRKRDQQTTGPWKLVYIEDLQTKRKDDRSLSTPPTCAQYRNFFGINLILE